MIRIGIRDFKAQATRIFKGVREQGARYVVTHHGRPTAVVLPLDADLPPEAGDAALDAAVDRLLTRGELRRELEALRAEVDRHWQSQESAVEVLDRQRR